MKVRHSNIFFALRQTMCRCCHKYKPERYQDGTRQAPSKREWCFCLWVLQTPREIQNDPKLPEANKALLRQWVTHPTCAGCIKKHHEPLYPGHPKYPKNPRPGDLFFLDDMGGVLRFGCLTGPPSTRPDPKDVERDQKKVADYIKEKQAKKDKELEEANKKEDERRQKEEDDGILEAMAAHKRAGISAPKVLVDAHKAVEERRAASAKALEERKAAAAKMDAENMEKLKRGAMKLGVAIVEAPKPPVN